MFERLWGVFLTLAQRFGAGQTGHAKSPALVPVQTVTQENFARPTMGSDKQEVSCTVYAAYDKLIQHLDSKQISFRVHEDERSICTDLRGDVGTYRIYARVDPEDRLFQVFGYMPLRVPEGCRPAIAEVLARVNFNLKLGKFELDYDDGTYRFQAAQILQDDDLADDTIHRVIGTTMAMLDTYGPAVLSVVYGNETPKDAVLQVERIQSRPAADDTGESPDEN